MRKLWICLFVLLTSYIFIEAALTPSPPALPGAIPNLYSSQNNDCIHDTLICSINKAKKSIVLIIYGLKDAKIIDALNQKARSGISVEVIYDSDYSAGVEQRLAKEVKLFPRKSSGLMHLKLLIIDGHHTWLGSANMTRESLKNNANLIAHLDDRAFSKIVLAKGKQLSEGHFEKPIPPQFFEISGQKIELRFLPDDQTALPKLKQMIDSAKKSVQVAMFTFTRQDLAESLIQAHKRGVDVKVVVDKESSTNTSKKIVALLKKNKVPTVCCSPGGVMHHKFVLIDNKHLAHGSANWTLKAFSQNDDYIMIISNLSPTQKKVMHAVWKSLLDAA